MKSNSNYCVMFSFVFVLYNLFTNLVAQEPYQMSWTGWFELYKKINEIEFIRLV